MEKVLKISSRTTVLLDTKLQCCCECPFHDGDFVVSCTCMDKDMTIDEMYSDGFPEWCPLEDADITCRVDGCNCFDVPISFFERCSWCKLKILCVDEYGELAARDSEYCRMLHVHFK